MQKGIYLKLLDHLEEDTVLTIPEEWGEIVLNCIECMISICSLIRFDEIRNVNGSLKIKFSLNGYEALRPYLEEEIYYANMDIRQLAYTEEEVEERGDDMLCGIDNMRCTKCQIITSESASIIIDGRRYCKSCGIKLKPISITIHKHADGVFVIGGKIQKKPVDIRSLEKCSWFLREKVVFNDGREKYKLEFNGYRICRAISEKDSLPNTWNTCNWYGACPF